MSDRLRKAGHRQRIAFTIGCLALPAFMACGSDESGAAEGAERSPQPSRDELSPGLAAQLDSGTAAYRGADYGSARRHYRAAAVLAPDVASTWLGVYMAEAALGNQDAAAAAMVRFRELGGATDMHHTPHGNSVPEAKPDDPEELRTSPG